MASEAVDIDLAYAALNAEVQVAYPDDFGVSPTVLKSMLDELSGPTIYEQMIEGAKHD